jgi:hypothetical protein
MIPVIGVPSSQCACCGHARTSADQADASRRRLRGWSRDDTNSVIDHVPASAGSVAIENDPTWAR